MANEGIGGRYLNRILHEIGKKSEADYLGTIDDKNPKYQKLLAKYRVNSKTLKPGKIAEAPRYSLDDAVQIARESQLWLDPTNPEKDFLKDLRLAVADELGFIKDEELEQLRIYTAVGSPLDFVHGRNFFLELIQSGKRIPLRVFGNLVAEDFEKKRKKEGVLYIDGHAIDDPENDKGNYLQKVTDIAGEVVGALQKEEARDMASRN
ncbi:MAG: hypothetical protein Q7R73_01985 [bacterium]|nr:hypothetical protein [bacterium]